MNSKRLLAIASFIEKDDTLVDVGCDHAYLDIYLVKNNLCRKVIASDISEGALSQARINIKKYKLSKKIDVVLSNGLDNIDCSKLNTIVISGMGTQTILNILKSDKIKNIKKIIIQSNNNLTELRIAMSKKGYTIEREVAVFENNKFYCIILFKPNKKRLSLSDILIGKYNADNLYYYKHLYEKNKKIYSVVPKYKINKRFCLLFKNLILKNYIKNS